VRSPLTRHYYRSSDSPPCRSVVRAHCSIGRAGALPCRPAHRSVHISVVSLRCRVRLCLRLFVWAFGRVGALPCRPPPSFNQPPALPISHNRSGVHRMSALLPVCHLRRTGMSFRVSVRSQFRRSGVRSPIVQVSRPCAERPTPQGVTSSPTLFRCRPDNHHTIVSSSVLHTKSPFQSIILCMFRKYVSHTTSRSATQQPWLPNISALQVHHVWIPEQVSHILTCAHTHNFGPRLRFMGTPNSLLHTGPTCPITLRAHCLEQPTVSPASCFI